MASKSSRLPSAITRMDRTHRSLRSTMVLVMMVLLVRLGEVVSDPGCAAVRRVSRGGAAAAGDSAEVLTVPLPAVQMDFQSVGVVEHHNPADCRLGHLVVDVQPSQMLGPGIDRRLVGDREDHRQPRGTHRVAPRPAGILDAGSAPTPTGAPYWSRTDQCSAIRLPRMRQKCMQGMAYGRPVAGKPGWSLGALAAASRAAVAACSVRVTALSSDRVEL